ncbi:hypothetical protein CC85DRAFT_284896 [Cutaneotrichosporon oleaginosum]|uniref:Autophagy-related protein 11 n=1 Tax=Cutaneotrichosporon oleaginosum TaxID=879819 RepID=A0A0J0XPY9_9TREE|nr:uncharacterized protein CC85DRAFT_284896 [Cutaneotrichosporon oleaginosum]KLT43142.1 hypothetical protein CC85DRAFT_284896 [Cutaneotrichosporon oleaginosum]TXT10069.1 hypothetical protein COLE_04003 [Cutaneotrichosporon oleaginosum]
MDVYLASDGGFVQIPHALSDYDSLEGVIADVSAATGLISGNVLLFTEDGRELKQEVLEELWERGGHGGGSSPQREVVYLFNRETFFSDPERWANELREEVVYPPVLEASGQLGVSQAQAPFAVAYDHLCHLQSLFKAQAHALRIAYANLAYHLDPIVQAFREFSSRAEDQLYNQEKLLAGYHVDMAMLPKVIVHEAVYRRRDKDSVEKRKALVDWIHTKKMEEVRNHCQVAHTDWVNRYNTVLGEMDELAIQSDADRQQAEHRILGVEHEFTAALERVDLAIQQVEALLRSGDVEADNSLRDLDQAMREDLAGMTAVKNDFTLDLHVHLRGIANYQVRMTKLTRPMTELDLDLRQKNAFPHLERLHNMPFAYAANIIEIVHRKNFASTLTEWASRLSRTLNTVLAEEARRRQQHKSDNLLPWEIAALEESQVARVDVSFPSTDILSATGLSRKDIDALLASLEHIRSDAEFQNLQDTENPIPPLLEQIKVLMTSLESSTLTTTAQLDQAAASSAAAPNELQELRDENAAYKDRLAEMEKHIRDMEERHERKVNMLQNRQGEMQEEQVRLRTDLSEEVQARQHIATELDDKSRECEELALALEEQKELVAALKVDSQQEKDRINDLGVRLQEALLDVDGLRSAEQTLIFQIREMQEERTRIITDLGEAQLLATNYESELAGTRAELEATSNQLTEAQRERDLALKNQSAEAERMMRDHIAEADGDRAVLEHQNLTLTKELETVRASLTEKLNAAKNAHVRREDGLKAELSFTKAQLREVQRRETVLSDELAMAKDASASAEKKGTHNSEIARDAVILAGKYHEACQRLMLAISSSTTISGSLSLPSRPKPAVPLRSGSPTSSIDMNNSSVLTRCLESASGFELDAFADAVLRTINLARKLSKSCKTYRELSRSKITISNFGKGDLVLFLPTRNAAVNAWAAFNISAPHHFLKVTEPIRQQLVGKDYYLARITATDEAVVNGDSPETNPYGLAEGLRYYSHYVEEWQPGQPRLSRRSMSSSAPATQKPSQPKRQVSQPVPRQRSLSPSKEESASPSAGPSPPPRISQTQPSPTAPLSPQPQSAGHSAIHSAVHSPLASSPAPQDSSPQDQSSAGDSPRRSLDVRSPPPRESTPRRSLDARSPPPPVETSPLRSLEARSPPAPSRRAMVSPPPPPSSPTTPFSPSAAFVRRSHRASLTSNASPPARDFAASLVRPSSVASSIGSGARAGTLPIPIAAAKGAPAAPVATSMEGSPSPSSFGDHGPGGVGALVPASRRLSTKGSAASLRGAAASASPKSAGPKGKAEDPFRPSPLGNSDAPTPTSAGGFLSGLSMSRKRNMSSGGGATALDILNKYKGPTA